VDIKKVRSRNRMAAGIKGEEQVVRMKDKDGAKLDFTWRYAGKRIRASSPRSSSAWNHLTARSMKS
jgi:hypothetical protein